MTGTTPWTAQDNVEPIAAATIGAIANMQGFAVVSGGASTYSGANMTIAVATGSAIHTNNGITITAGNVTLVSDPTNPRWAYHYVNSSGTPSIVMGTAAATPAIPDPGANVTLGLTYIQAALTLATNATYKLDKRVIAPAGGVQQIVKSAIETVNNSNALQSDNDFFFTALASTDYAVTMYLRITTADAANFKFAFTKANLTWDGQYNAAITPGAGGSVNIANQQAQTSGTGVLVDANGGALTSGLLIINATIHSGATTAAVNFQWAQNTADATDTSVLKNSWMEVRVLGAT